MMTVNSCSRSVGARDVVDRRGALDVVDVLDVLDALDGVAGALDGVAGAFDVPAAPASYVDELDEPAAFCIRQK
jgi:hypothetical protein